jgi:7-cyano-7-deazaguanine synthase
MLCLHLLRERELNALPVFVNYGQRNFDREWSALLTACEKGHFSRPVKFDVPAFGEVIRSGLTDPTLRVNEDAFTPNRNLLFLLLGASVAYTRGIPNIALGLLAERTTIFPDQSDKFLGLAEEALQASLGAKIVIHAPLRDFTKKDVVEIANQRKITNFYSCHAGTELPCGKCIACLEYI